MLFIVSEVLFFFSFFWRFFHRRLSSCVELGLVWPPVAVSAFNPFQIPLLNTIVLLCSGVRVTWAHHALIEKDQQQVLVRIFITVRLGLYFTFLQGTEYYESSFNLRDSVYATTFFVATGFHGIHVIVGTIMLLVSLVRLGRGHCSFFHGFGLEASIWYWHFVDIVWIFLYTFVYWWGWNI